MSDMKASCKALQIVEYGKPYQINSVEIPDPGPDDLLIRIKAASYCHTDLLILEGNPYKNKLPMTGGHEQAGIVEKVGENVKSFKKGDRVAYLNLYHPCGQCLPCKSDSNGKSQYCSGTRKELGITSDGGGFAEYAICDPNCTAKIPDNMEFKEASPLTCAGITSFAAIKKTGLSPGQWLGVVGTGGLGHLATQLGKAMGFNVVGIDIRDEALGFVSKLGKLSVDMTLNPNREEDMKKVMDKSMGGMNGIIVVTDSNSGLSTAMEIAAKRATIVVVALSQNQVSVYEPHIIYKDLLIKGSLLGSPTEFRQMFQLIQEHGINVNIHKTFLPEQIEELIQELNSGKVIGRLSLAF